jgi:hypothetical protein
MTFSHAVGFSLVESHDYSVPATGHEPGCLRELTCYPNNNDNTMYLAAVKRSSILLPGTRS